MKKILVVLAWLVHSIAGAAAPSWELALKESIRAKLPKGARVEIENLRVSLPIAKRFRIWGFSPDHPVGLVTFQAETQSPQGAKKTIGSATVRVFAPVAVARRGLAHGEAMDETTVGFEERELSRLGSQGYFIERSVLQGRTAKGYVGVGQVIHNSNSQLPFEVAAGQTVELVREKGSLVLRAKVRALQNGMKNQWIQVQNPTTGKVVAARVAGQGEVVVQ